jgi:hypothetical protein
MMEPSDQREAMPNSGLDSSMRIEDVAKIESLIGRYDVLLGEVDALDRQINAMLATANSLASRSDLQSPASSPPASIPAAAL